MTRTVAKIEVGRLPETADRVHSKPITTAHLGKVVVVHMAAFSESALTALGAEAVRRYYSWLLDERHDSFCLGAWRGENLDGFIFSGHFKGATGGFIRRNRGFLMWSILVRPWMVLNEEFRQRMRIGLKALIPRRRPNPRSDRSLQDLRPSRTHFGVMSIAVHPRAWGEGVGELLMERADEEARCRGADEAILTVHPTNSRAVRFYEKLGWEKVDASSCWEGKMLKMLVKEGSES